MSNNRFKFGQIIGIVVGVVAGSLIIQSIIGPKRQQVQVVQVHPSNFPNSPNPHYQQQGVFEQALSSSLPKS